MINYKGFGKYAVCFSSYEKKIKNKLRILLSKFLNKNPDFYISIGKIVFNIMEIKESFRQANNVIDWSFYRPDNRIIIYKECEPLIEYLDFGDKFLDTMLLGDSNSTDTLSTMKKAFNDTLYMEHLQKRRALFGLKNFIAKRTDLMPCLNEFQSIKELHRYIYSVETFDRLKDFVMSVLDTFILHIDSLNTFSPIVQRILNYISNNYWDQSLNVLKICDTLHFSATHLNKALLLETGDTLSIYIAKYRVNASKFLLKNSNATIKEIAGKCGFADAGYFARTFKKHTNMTPLEYRACN